MNSLASCLLNFLISENCFCAVIHRLQELRSYIIARVSWNPTSSGPTYSELTHEFVPTFYGEAAAPFIFDYLALMTASAAKHGVIGSRKWYVELAPRSILASTRSLALVAALC